MVIVLVFLINYKIKVKYFLTKLQIGHTKLTHEYLIAKDAPLIYKTSRITLSIKRILSECH